MQSFVRTYGFPAVITRSTNNYAPYQFPGKFLPLVITNALAGKSLRVYGDGGQQRNWLHFEDYCRGSLAVLEKGRPGGVHNIGGLDVVDDLAMVRRPRLYRHLGQFVVSKREETYNFRAAGLNRELRLVWYELQALCARVARAIVWGLFQCS